MQEGKHLEALGEVDAYIEESLQAPELVPPQPLPPDQLRRLERLLDVRIHLPERLEMLPLLHAAYLD